MGTHGVEVIRDRGVYYVWYRSHDGYPRGLGLKMHRMVPQNPRMFSLWRMRLRKKLVAHRHVYNAYVRRDGEKRGGTVEMDGELVCISRTWDYDSYSYVYELDLDNKVFLFNRCPVYHLDNLPPEDIFPQEYDELEDESDVGMARCFYKGIPKEHQFDQSRLKGPVVKPGKIKTYKKLYTDTVTDPRSIILPLPCLALSRVEDLTLHLLADYASFYLRTAAVVMYHDMALTSETLSDDHLRGQEVAWLFVAMSLFPLQIIGQANHIYDAAWREFFSRAGYEFWFIRKHICVTLGTCLLDERNTESHISRLVDKIIRTPDAPEVTYGVVFSLFHCVVIRVDKAAGGRFSRTKVLEFLPTSPMLIGEQRITMGMETLIRLRSVPGEDDFHVFHSWLSIRWWDFQWARRRLLRRHANDSEDEEAGIAEVTTEDESLKPTPPPPGPQLPIELLVMIVPIIENPEDLFNFALVSKMHMAAAIPRLWLPQVWGDTGYGMEGHILEARVRDPFPEKFQIRYKDRPALLRLRFREDMRSLPDRHTSLAMMDGGDTMPRADLNFNLTRLRGRTCFRYHSFMLPHPYLGFYTWWGPETVKELRGSLEERILENGGILPADLKGAREAIESREGDEILSD